MSSLCWWSALKIELEIEDLPLGNGVLPNPGRPDGLHLLQII